MRRDLGNAGLGRDLAEAAENALTNTASEYLPVPQGPRSAPGSWVSMSNAPISVSGIPFKWHENGAPVPGSAVIMILKNRTAWPSYLYTHGTQYPDQTANTIRDNCLRATGPGGI
ncbi:hypothetical protein GCM10027089_41760 [Nocardia thraciensis]